VKDTNHAFAWEDLQGIRAAVTVCRSPRAAGHSRAFPQLWNFVIGKAKRAGASVSGADPCSTDRACPKRVCDHVGQAHHPAQFTFSYVVRGFAGLADYIAAVNLPIVARDETGRLSRWSLRSSGQLAG